MDMLFEGVFVTWMRGALITTSREILGKIGRDPIVSKSKQLQVGIFYFYLLITDIFYKFLQNNQWIVYALECWFKAHMWLVVWNM